MVSGLTSRRVFLVSHPTSFDVLLATQFRYETRLLDHPDNKPPLHKSLDHETLIDADLAMRISVDLKEFIETSNISLWVHGHFHKKQDYFCGKTRIVCNPRGHSNRTEPLFNSNYVVEI